MRCLRRFDFGPEDDYPYRSHGQPFTAYMSLASCLFILIVAKGAPLWVRFRTQPFLSGYLAASFPPKNLNTNGMAEYLYEFSQQRR